MPKPSLHQEITTFLTDCQSLHLSTIRPDGKPSASYAPFAHDETAFYILISELAEHMQNLLSTPDAAVLLIEDEQDAGNIFARKRLSYKVTAEAIERGTDRWMSGVALLKARHGAMVDQLLELSDFRLFCLVPSEGRLVKGFGQAYELDVDGLAKHINPVADQS